MAIKGLEQAVENLSRISRTAVPGAAAMAINRVASSAISQSVAQVARETKVRRKLVKERARLKRATVKNPQARIRVNRGDLPVIKLGNARVVLSRRRRRKTSAVSAERRCPVPPQWPLTALRHPRYRSRWHRLGAAFSPERWRQRA
ncbi:phage tail protein, partial [Escherichia coli]|uniref:phage tail protein n=1 Tax=Escherichia coli TaxID=562 RepID=UPI00201A33AB